MSPQSVFTGTLCVFRIAHFSIFFMCVHFLLSELLVPSSCPPTPPSSADRHFAGCVTAVGGVRGLAGPSCCRMAVGAGLGLRAPAGRGFVLESLLGCRGSGLEQDGKPLSFASSFLVLLPPVVV